MRRRLKRSRSTKPRVLKLDRKYSLDQRERFPFNKRLGWRVEPPSIGLLASQSNSKPFSFPLWHPPKPKDFATEIARVRGPQVSARAQLRRRRSAIDRSMPARTRRAWRVAPERAPGMARGNVWSALNRRCRGHGSAASSGSPSSCSSTITAFRIPCPPCGRRSQGPNRHPRGHGQQPRSPPAMDKRPSLRSPRLGSAPRPA